MVDIYTVLAPYITPVLSQTIGVLDQGSKAVIDNDDQYEVFNNPSASDPSHSMLSKDHFALILNEPAGKIAQVVVEHTVNLIVQAWSDENVDAEQTVETVLEAFHHPYYATGRSAVQDAMFKELEKWVGELEDVDGTMESLSKEAVREHKNKRKGLEEIEEPGYGGCAHDHGGGGGGGGYQTTTTTTSKSTYKPHHPAGYGSYREPEAEEEEEEEAEEEEAEEEEEPEEEEDYDDQEYVPDPEEEAEEEAEEEEEGY